MANIVLFGGTGFIGRYTAEAAVASGHRLKAIVRNRTKAEHLKELGVEVVLAPALKAEQWRTEIPGADVLIDLTQPAIPRRLTVSAAQRVSEERSRVTRSICEALSIIPRHERPLLLTASGTDDLLPDAHGVITDASDLRSRPRGFGHIGIPVRKLIQTFADQQELDAAYIYFGNVVYGPGKAFTERIVTGLRTRSMRVIGNGQNRLPVTSVRDAAASLVFLAAQPRAQVSGASFLAVTPQPISQREFLETTADALRADRPSSVPAIIAAAAAGSVNAQVMTLDAEAKPRALTSMGFRFMDADPFEGIRNAVAAIRADSSQPSALPQNRAMVPNRPSDTRERAFRCEVHGSLSSARIRRETL